jgi:hypothetical protein
VAPRPDEALEGINQASAKISEARRADVVLFCGNLYFQEDRAIANLIRWKRKKENLFFILGTFGGSANSAYRIGKCFRNAYKRITVFVPSFCKSAGTLLALSADELVLGDSGELGPLDVQLLHHDVADTTSGLTQKQALVTLRSEIAESFKHIFLQIRRETRISTELAAKTAGEIVTGVFSEIFDRFDPMMIGEHERAMEIARSYGDRLSRGRQHLRRKAIDKLIKNYPAHDFVIDRDDAKDLFSNLTEPTEYERRLSLLLSRIIETTLFDDDEQSPIIEMLPFKEEGSDAAPDTTTGRTEGEGAEPTGTPGTPGTPEGDREISGGTVQHSPASTGEDGNGAQQSSVGAGATLTT